MFPQLAPPAGRAQMWSMVRKSGNRFSEKIMLAGPAAKVKVKRTSEPPLVRKLFLFFEKRDLT